MKKILFFLTAAIMAMSLSAAPVDQATAMRKAQSFLSQHYAGKVMSPAATTPVLLKAEMGKAKINQPVYYIYNTSTTFIVVAGDDRAEEILMVGDRPLRDVNNLPLGLRDMLGQYKDQIMFLQEHPGLRPTSVQEPTPTLNATTYGPLLTCNWDQEAPYYNQCKFGSYQCLTGCPATSASMVFYFWKYPTAATPAVPGYKSTISYSSYGSKSYTHSALPSVTFDWANMLDDYTGSYTTAQGNAVATLMHYVGQAERMGYGTSAAGGSGVSVDSVCNIRDAFTFFGYDSSTTRFVKKTSAYSGGTTLYSDSQWAALIQEEMAAGRPIVFCAVSSNAGGHAFNVDGYNSSTNKYHVNFGWSGDGNAWCSLNSFGYSSYNFNVYQQMVIGIQPPTTTATPTLTVSPTSLSFSATAGETVSKTFTVTGTNLTGNVTLSKTDANGVYTISPTTISASAAASGATVTVTYKPTAAGTHTGSITIASSGATSKTVSLSGTATAAALTTYTPVMSAANSSYITSSSFRADWTDQTTSANVSSYTLQVNSQSSTPSNEVALLGTINGSGYTGSYKTITLSSPWGGTNVKGGNSAVYFTKSGKITFTIPSGYSNATFSVKITTVTGTYGTGNVTVGSTQTSAVGHTFSKGETYTWIVTGSAGDVITLTTTDTSYSPDMSLIQVYAGNTTLNASESGDSSARTITGITNKYYTVSNLTAGTTYIYKVKALYTDGTSSDWSNEQSVTLSEEQQTATPTLTVTPTSLSMSAQVGATKTATFKVTGADLTGNVTLSLSGASVFSISPTTITAANAANGVNVTVTYAPTAYGSQTATVTIASEGAASKTVALTGNATLDKSDPVLTDATNISSTSFTANWTHDVDASSVSSYTMYGTLTAQPSTGDDEPTTSLLGTIDGSNYTGSYASITLTSPWGGSNVRAGNGAVYTKNSSSWWWGTTTYGTITFTVPSGYSNGTFTVMVTSANSSYGTGNITVKSTKTSAVGHTFTKGETYAWTITASAGDVITIYSTDSSYSPDMTLIQVYAGTATLNATATGDNTDFVITDIDAGSTGITLSNLVEGGTYSYYIVANYVDGTTATSNTQEVTLLSMNFNPNTAINSIVADGDEIESITYVNMSGMQSKEPFEGVNIKVVRYKNGAVKSSKVLY